MKKLNFSTFVVFVFLFTNYYNPFSVYITLLVNISLTVFFLLITNKYIIKIDVFVVAMTTLLLCWSFIVVLNSGDVDAYVIGKYLRVSLSTYLIIFICIKLNITAEQLNKVLSTLFLCHIIAIFAQTISPDLSVSMATVFGLSDSESFFTEYSSIKMGLCGSFDTASLISISSMMYFFLQHRFKKKARFIVLACLSFAACTMSSRVGMILGGTIFFIFLFLHSLRAKGIERFLVLSLILIGAGFTAYFILPIILYSFQIDFTGFGGVSGSNEYGAGGSVRALTGSHLEPLNVPFMDLFFGMGYDPHGTDIGYVKLIYHIGIIGMALILILYSYMYFKVYLLSKKYRKYIDMYILSKFFILYLALLIVMNYKSLEIYSRGAHDLLIIIFFVLINKKLSIRTNSIYYKSN